MRKLIKGIYDQMFKSGSHSRYNFKLYMRQFRHYRQRLTKGFDDSETWSLFIDNSQWLVPRLERFIELQDCHPGSISNDEWIEILNKIILAHKIIAKDDFRPEEKTIVEEGLKLYAEWYLNLWW